MRPVRGLSLVLALVLALVVPVLVAAPAEAAGDFRFADSVIVASEGQALVRVLVRRGDLPVSHESIAYRTEAGTATPAADYAETSGTLTFGVGETQQSFVVFLHDDDVAEERETVVLVLDGSATSAIRLAIDDDDQPVTASTARDDAVPPAPAPGIATTAGNDHRTAPVSSGADGVRPVAAAATPRRADPVNRNAAAATPRRVDVRQTPVTPFELRAAPRGPAGPAEPGDVDAGLAMLAALVLARVGAEVWFRTRALAA